MNKEVLSKEYTKYTLDGFSGYWFIEQTDLKTKWRLCLVNDQQEIINLIVSSASKCMEKLSELISEERESIVRTNQHEEFRKHIESLNLGMKVECNMSSAWSDNVLTRITPTVVYDKIIKRNVSDKDYSFIERNCEKIDWYDEEFVIDEGFQEDIKMVIDENKIEFLDDKKLNLECELEVDGRDYLILRQKYSLDLECFDIDKIKECFVR